MIGLVWNSMMSMAGGWFFLTVNEAFTLGDRDFRLPGIGSYMNVAIDRGDTPRHGCRAVVGDDGMIVVVDQVVWRPAIGVGQKYKLEETTPTRPSRGLSTPALRRSRSAAGPPVAGGPLFARSRGARRGPRRGGAPAVDRRPAQGGARSSSSARGPAVAAWGGVHLCSRDCR